MRNGRFVSVLAATDTFWNVPTIDGVYVTPLMTTELVVMAYVPPFTSTGRIPVVVTVAPANVIGALAVTVDTVMLAAGDVPVCGKPAGAWTKQIEFAPEQAPELAATCVTPKKLIEAPPMVVADVARPAPLPRTPIAMMFSFNRAAVCVVSSEVGVRAYRSDVSVHVQKRSEPMSVCAAEEAEPRYS